MTNKNNYFLILLLLSFSFTTIKAQEYKKYFKNGQLKVVGNYKNGKKVGKWESFNANGTPFFTINYDDNGIIDGEYKYYWFDGELVETIISEKGKEISSKWEKYYNNQLFSTDINEDTSDEKHKFTIFYKNGTIYKAYEMDGRKLEKVIICQNKHGKALQIGTFKNGNGTINEYNKKGKLINIVTYKNGKIIENNVSVENDWTNWAILNNYAWNVYENEDNPIKLKQAIIWIKRSIHLNKTASNTDSYALLLFKINKKRKAVRWIKKSIKIEEKYFNTQSYAYLLYKQGKLQKAFKWIKRSVDLSSNYQNNLFYATVLFDMKKYKEAKNIAEKAKEKAIEKKIEHSELIELIEKINNKL